MRTAKKALILTGTLALLLLAFGCSTETITGPQSNDTISNVGTIVNGPDFVLPPGLELVTSFDATSTGNNGSLDGGTRPPSGPTRPAMSAASIPMTPERGGTITSGFVSCVIPAGALPYDATITAAVPNPAEAVVDFGPHPLQFNAPVQIRFNMNALGIDAANDELFMWYVAEDGTLEPIPLTVDGVYAVGNTDHFSRYILTRLVY